MKYGRLKNGKVEYAGKVIRLDDGSVVVNPKEADLLAAGYLHVVDEPPATDDEHVAVPTGWEERDGAVRRTYEIREKPPRTPRVFVTADLVEALMAEGIWEDARAWIVKQGMLDLVLATKEFDEGNKNFRAGRAALQAALGWTDEEVEALLAKCVKDA